MDSERPRDDRACTLAQGSGGRARLALLDCLSCPVILLDSSAKVQETTGSARRLLGPDLMVRGGRLCASDRASDELLQALIQSCLSDTEPSTRSFLPPILLRQQEKRPLVIQAMSANLFPGLMSEAGVVLILTGLEVWPELPVARLKLLFGLTRSEARLAARLATGETLENAAKAVQVATGTARNQAIFAKTGTCRQAQLVALLWRASHLAVNDQSKENSPATPIVWGRLAMAEGLVTDTSAAALLREHDQRAPFRSIRARFLVEEFSDGYDIQDELVRRMREQRACGVIGHNIGLRSPRMQVFEFPPQAKAIASPGRALGSVEVPFNQQT